MEVSTINHISEATNDTMAMSTTNNNMTTLTTSTLKSPLKFLHNEWIHVGHLWHPDEAANEILDFVKALAAHGVCYALTVKKPMQCNCLASLSSQLEKGPCRVHCICTPTQEQQQKQLIKDVQMSCFIVRGQDQVAKLHCFLLPGSLDHLICIGTYSKLIGYGKDTMITVKKHAESHTTPSHGLKG